MSDSDANVTSLFPRLCSLSPMQMRALALRIQGEPVGRIAKRLGVTRQTIYRWCNHHPAFVAELNRRQAELLADSNISYRRLLRKSFNVLKEALDGNGTNSVRVALSIVNGSASRKLLSPDVGPTDEIGVVNQLAIAEQLTWEPKQGYIEPCVHQEYAQRLAQLDFDPEPATTPANQPKSDNQATP